MQTYEEKATGSSLTAYMLALYTGQRESDVLRMRRDAIDVGALEVVQDKGGAKLWIQFTLFCRSTWTVSRPRITRSKG